MIRNIFTILFLFFTSIAFSQRVTILKTEFETDKVNIIYDLEGEAEGQLFEVSLFSSVNNFSTPMVFVSGEVGKNIKVGKGKKIVWNSAKELMSYKGNITFEVKAVLTHSPLSLNTPVSGESLRRGSTYPISWTGGAGSTPKIELFKGTNLVMSIPKSENKNAADLVLPIKMKPGGDYVLKLTASNGTVGSDIKIKRKIPLALKIAPIVLLGGAAIIILSSHGSKDSKSNPPPSAELPGPPGNP